MSRTIPSVPAKPLGLQRQSRSGAMTNPNANVNQMVELELIAIRRGDNDRTFFDQTELESLANSMRDDGLTEPIVVRPVKSAPPILYEIVAGERRFRAAQFLGWEKIPSVIRKYTDEQAAAVMLNENVQRADLDPLDECGAYEKRMRMFGWSVNQVARKAKIPEKRVAARLLLSSLIPEMKEMLRRKEIALSFCETMAPLDVNRQRIAMRYLTTTNNPLLREFKSLCGKLLAQQNQGALMDLQAIDVDAVIAEAKVEGRPKRWDFYETQIKPRFPIAAYMPPMKKVGTIGESFEAYLVVCLEHEDPDVRNAAPIVGAMYDSMVRYGMCFPPNPKKSIRK
jgi:ParB/RepB/Spo0J family partition protein